MVMGHKKVGREVVYMKVPYEPSPGTKRFICGSCVARGRLGEFTSRNFDPVVDLKAWRKSTGITQAKLAEALGVTKAMVSMVENGEKPMPPGWQKTLSEKTLG